MANKIIVAFTPIIELVQGMAFPLAYISISIGICLVIIGQKREGLNMVKWAITGYILAQWLPGMMRILADVGSAMAQ